MNPTGLYYIDGMDIYTVFGMFVEEGTDDFLKFAARKESITHDWKDSHGIDVDATRVFLKEKEVNLKVNFIVTSEADFWLKYDAFIAQMTLPGKRRIEPKELGDRQFYCLYKECTALTRFTRIKNSSKIAIKYNVKFVDTNENFTPVAVFIVDEDGRFLVT